MYNVLLGIVIGLSIGVTFEVYAEDLTRSTSPYAPGSFMSETNVFNKMLDNNTDSYLRNQYRDPWSPCR